MNELGKRLKQAREYLELTQADVAKLIGVSRVVITNIELGTRKVSAEELLKFSKLYGWTMEELLQGEKSEDKILAFVRTFEELSKEDQEEIINLIKFKKMYRIMINSN